MHSPRDRLPADPWLDDVCTSFEDTRTTDGFTCGTGVGVRHDSSVAVHGSCRSDWIDFDNAEGTPDFDGSELEPWLEVLIPCGAGGR